MRHWDTNHSAQTNERAHRRPVATCTPKAIYCVINMCTCHGRESRSDSICASMNCMIRARLFTGSVRYPTHFSGRTAYHTTSALPKPIIVSLTCVHAMARESRSDSRQLYPCLKELHDSSEVIHWVSQISHAFLWMHGISHNICTSKAIYCVINMCA